MSEADDAVRSARSRKEARREAIEQAAYKVLVRDGYKAASLLAIAKEGQASNETLYRWYGSKQALFASLVEGNAEDARALLDRAFDEGDDPAETLTALGPVLLKVVTSERAVALNRAAAGDVYDSGKMGEALGKGGRAAIVPRIAKLIARLADKGVMRVDDPEEAADVYVALLIGDLQIRLVTGALAGVTEDDLSRRSARALALLHRLYG
ncbi:MAG: TetR/AcrR family transcriptional regulator C-terminal domain-containing protein [Pseudomonadota bacterium]